MCCDSNCITAISLKLKNLISSEKHGDGSKCVSKTMTLKVIQPKNYFYDLLMPLVPLGALYTVRDVFGSSDSLDCALGNLVLFLNYNTDPDTDPILF